jgi:hypothetical protein
VNDLDLTHIYQSYDANNPDRGKAITIAFKSNSNTNVNNYGFTMFTNGTSYTNPMLIQTKTNLFLKYYDLTDILLTTLANYNVSTYSWATAAGDFAGGGVRPFVVGCGQKVINCMIDLYSNHGWLSVWATVQSAFLPQTAVAVAATCAIHNCL